MNSITISYKENHVMSCDKRDSSTSLGYSPKLLLEGVELKVLELFAGTRSIGKAFERKGHDVFSVDWDKQFEDIDLYIDISKLTSDYIIENFGKPDVIWASPDCTSYSIAAISHHRKKNPETGNLDPVSDYAKFCDMCNNHLLDLIHELDSKYYFIENPRGGFARCRG